MNHFAYKTRAMVLLALFTLPLQAMAHSSDDGGGFLAGLAHPVMGMDHLLAMVSVGIVSALIGGRHIWVVPSCFVGAMVFGTFVGIWQWNLPEPELWIGLSVLVLGVCIGILAKRVPLVLIYVSVALFGLFHGYAHGVEMPNSASPAFYSFGFITTTSALHLLGVGVGELSIRRAFLLKGLRVAGWGMSLAGMWFTVQAVHGIS
jgi:urease accessory protein